jgi:DNA (cytosine-5)-methyltransferase 3A
MNVLSLFDGMSCGQIALSELGVKYNKYYASEIDVHAIKVAKTNYPETIQLGDVTKLNSKELPKIDLLIGGSPCTGFSMAGKRLNFEDPRSRLFFEYIRLLKELKPKYFLLENVKMKKEWENTITEHMGVEPIEINSSLVSGQNRVRLYWTNIPIKKLEDKKITISDIIGEECIGAARRARYINGTDGKTEQRTELRTDKKANAMTTVKKNSMIQLKDGTLRYLTRNEAEELQNVPKDYTLCISETQAHKMLGNGWTVGIIKHILSGIK